MSEKPIEFACQLSPVERPGTSDFRLYDEAMSDARLGHALGYTTGWVIEHHFSDYYPVPNPLMLLSNVAAQCPGFGLGTSVMVLPWYNPIRLAIPNARRGYATFLCGGWVRSRTKGGP